MSFLTQYERILRIDQLIRLKSTGNCKEFAKKLNLSKSGLLKILAEMKKLGFPIRFNSKRKNYEYELEGFVCKSLFIKIPKELTRDEMKNILGGTQNNYYLGSTYNRPPYFNFTDDYVFIHQKIKNQMEQKKQIGRTLSRGEMKKITGGYEKYTCWGTCLDGSTNWWTTSSESGVNPGCQHHGGAVQGATTCWGNPLPIY